MSVGRLGTTWIRVTINGKRMRSASFQTTKGTGRKTMHSTAGFSPPSGFMAFTLPSQRNVATRQFHQCTRFNHPRKDTQDKDGLNPPSTEYIKSGSDGAAAESSDIAFNPKQTSQVFRFGIAGNHLHDIAFPPHSKCTRGRKSASPDTILESK